MTIYLEVDGQPVPVEQCFWMQFSPCGCASGVAVADLRGAPLITEDLARIEFTRTNTKLEVERDKAAGYTMKLVTRQQYRDTYMEQIKGSCPHDPKWGHVVPPIPEGFEWRYKGPFSRARFQHLVDVEFVGPGVHGKVAALCRAEARGYEWVTDVFQSERVLDCSKCLTAAAKFIVEVARDQAHAEKETVDVGTG